MRRPLAVIGFSYSAALMVAFFLGNILTAAALVSVVLLGALLNAKLRKTVYLPAGCIAACLALVTLWGYRCAYVDRTDLLMEQEVHIKAVIRDLPYEQNDRMYYSLKTTQVDYPASPQTIPILISASSALRAEPFDTIEVTVHIYAESERDRLPHIAKGNYLRGSLIEKEPVRVTKNEQKPLYNIALQVRKCVMEKIRLLFPEKEGAFVSALLIGDKASMSYDDQAVFRNAGISHIIVASGFHLAILSGFITAVLGILLDGRKNVASLVSVLFVFAYMAVVGFTPSIMRAGIMTIIMLLGRFAFRQADSINSLGAAVMIICFLNPYAVCDVGFLLSVSASLGIVTLSEPLTERTMEWLVPMNSDHSLRVKVYDKWNGKLKTMIEAVAVPFSAMLFTFPLTIVYFHFFAPYAVLTNLLITPAASLLLPLLFLTITVEFSVVFAFWTKPLLAVCQWLTQYILWTAETIGNLPYAGIRASAEYVPIALFCTAAAGVVCYICRRFGKARRSRQSAAFSALSVLLAAALIFLTGGGVIDALVKADSVKVSVLDTGNGISVLLSDGEESAVLSCGGSYDKVGELVNYLSESSCKKIDYVLLTCHTSQSSAYAGMLLRYFHAGTVQVYDEQKCSEQLHRQILSADEVIMSSSKSRQISRFTCCKIEISVYKTLQCNAVAFSVRGYRYLIIQDETDCAELPLEMRSCDMLIVCGKAVNSQYLTADSVLVSDSAARAEADAAALQMDTADVMCTAGKGSIGIRTYADGRRQIRREYDWLN